MAWAAVQVHNAYPAFVSQLDRLQPEDVIWEPYTHQAVYNRAHFGLLSMCTRDAAHWMTQRAIAFGIIVEPYCVERVMRQFGRRQRFPLPSPVKRVPRNIHG